MGLPAHRERFRNISRDLSPGRCVRLCRDDEGPQPDHRPIRCCLRCFGELNRFRSEGPPGPSVSFLGLSERRRDAAGVTETNMTRVTRFARLVMPTRLARSRPPETGYSRSRRVVWMDSGGFIHTTREDCPRRH